MNLIPLSEIPVSARKVEEDARRLLENHAAAVDAFRRKHRTDREGERWILTSADDGTGYLAICLPSAVRS